MSAVDYFRAVQSRNPLRRAVARYRALRIGGCPRGKAVVLVAEYRKRDRRGASD